MATLQRYLRVGTTSRQLVPPSTLGDRREVTLDFSPSQGGGGGNVFIGPDSSVTTTTGAQIPFGSFATLHLDADAELWAISTAGSQLVAVIITEPSDLSWAALERDILPLVRQSVVNQHRIIALLEAQLRAMGGRAVPGVAARGAGPPRGRALIAPED